MNFSPNKIPIEIIKESAFGGTYFKDIFSSINEKWSMKRICSVKKYRC